jgi:tetratricopeptide (TPR) repeat protein
MGKIYARDGQYDEALKAYVRAIELARKANDSRRAALISHEMGIIFVDRGRYGAAVSSMQDSLKGLTALGEQKSRDVAVIQNDLAMALARSGRLDEAQAALDSDQPIVKELRSDPLSAALLTTQGDIYFYRGNLTGAAQQYQKAIQTAGRKDNGGVTVPAQLGLARVALRQGRDKEAAKNLAPLVNKKNELTASLSIQISTAYAEALVRGKDTARARQMLLGNLGDVEKAGMRPRAAAIYYTLALAAKAGGNLEEAASYGRQAIKTLDAMRNEPGGDKVLQRADLSAVYQDCNQLAAAAKG